VQKLNADELKKVNIARYTAFYFGLSAAIILMNETLERIASKRNKDS
jgi:predicted cation transporter